MIQILGFTVWVTGFVADPLSPSGHSAGLNDDLVENVGFGVLGEGFGVAGLGCTI
jgi:hypothetical protein